MPERSFVGFSGRVERIHVCPRHYQNMLGRLGTDVLESDADIIFINPGGRNLTPNYLAKEAIASHIVCVYYTTNGFNC